MCVCAGVIGGEPRLSCVGHQSEPQGLNLTQTLTQTQTLTLTLTLTLNRTLTRTLTRTS